MIFSSAIFFTIYYSSNVMQLTGSLAKPFLTVLQSGSTYSLTTGLTFYVQHISNSSWKSLATQHTYSFISFTRCVSPCKLTSLQEMSSFSRLVNNLPPTSRRVAAYFRGLALKKGRAQVKEKPESSTSQQESCRSSGYSKRAASLIIEWVEERKRASNSKSSKATSANLFQTISGTIGGKVSAKHDAFSSNFLNLLKIYFQITVSMSESCISPLIKGYVICILLCPFSSSSISLLPTYIFLVFLSFPTALYIVYTLFSAADENLIMYAPLSTTILLLRLSRHV